MVVAVRRRISEGVGIDLSVFILSLGPEVHLISAERGVVLTQFNKGNLMGHLFAMANVCMQEKAAKVLAEYLKFMRFKLSVPDPSSTKISYINQPRSGFRHRKRKNWGREATNQWRNPPRTGKRINAFIRTSASS